MSRVSGMKLTEWSSMCTTKKIKHEQKSWAILGTKLYNIQLPDGWNREQGGSAEQSMKFEKQKYYAASSEHQGC